MFVQTNTMTIDESTTLFDLTEHFPETIPLLVDAGFARIDDPDVRRRFGSTVTVKKAALAHQRDPGEFLSYLQRAIRGPERARAIRIVGLVPCPIRVPMVRVLEQACTEFTNKTGTPVHYDLQAAYIGTEWMEEGLADSPTAEDLPEIFLSAGFRMFFTNARLRKLRAEGAFIDRTGWERQNEFGITNDLADPDGAFSVIGVVPAVFIVNRELLGGREVPQSWADILQPEFENSLALPVGDFDLFDALLLGIHRQFGTEGIDRLARNLFRSMHPSQMVAEKADQPLISVMPYFFTRTITEESPHIAVWPSDGALSAPILLVTRGDRPETQPLIDTIAGESMSKVISRLGLFPSTHPANDDFDGESYPLRWPGWDLLLSEDLEGTLTAITTRFESVGASR